MKLFFRNSMAFALAVVMLCVPATAATTSIGYSQVEVPIGASSVMELQGYIQPTIMTVTMPSKVSFDVQKSISQENKVLSPRIVVQNNSTYPVNISMEHATVDISSLDGTIWSENGIIGDYSLAMGITKERQLNQAPETFQYTNWIVDGYHDKNIMQVDSHDQGAMYVVGGIGKYVPDNKSFKVAVRFVVTIA